ncbi:hypothetical protein ACEE60_01065 [Streptococcus suis]|nr:hypothetical protein [Streptococcus suis]
MQRIEKNPIKIIYKTKNKLLPVSVWISYLILVMIILVLTFIVPDTILNVDFQVFETWQFIVMSLSALAFILSMYMFGREVYSIEDFAKFYLSKPEVYYGYLADYLFPSLLWCIIIMFSIFKMVIVITIEQVFLELLQVIFLSIVILAIVSTITLVIHNMNRVSNKVVQKSREISKD